MTDFIRQLAELALATRLKRLSDRLIGDVGRIYREQGFDFDPRWFALLQLLQQEGSVTVTDAAGMLRLTHPAIVQLSAQLEEAKLISTGKDKNDGRKRNMQLTSKGSDLLKRLTPLLKDIEDANREFLESTGYDVLSIIEKLEKALDEKDMYKRVKERTNRRSLGEVEIVGYQPRWKKDFRKLNYEWLNEYFHVEGRDKQVLLHPEEEILLKDGQIFFAKEKNKVVGTCAVNKVNTGVYEISKMAVTRGSRGRQIGKKLALAAIDYSRRKKARRVVLETSRKLDAAMGLYEQLGFVTESKLSPVKYERSTIRMTLEL